ncbi:MAG: hypothetical protein GY835_22515 [bacterium]|nr:hypothetical protein [bacterium]
MRSQIPNKGPTVAEAILVIIAIVGLLLIVISLANCGVTSEDIATQMALAQEQVAIQEQEEALQLARSAMITDLDTARQHLSRTIVGLRGMIDNGLEVEDEPEARMYLVQLESCAVEMDRIYKGLVEAETLSTELLESSRRNLIGVQENLAELEQKTWFADVMDSAIGAVSDQFTKPLETLTDVVTLLGSDKDEAPIPEKDNTVKKVAGVGGSAAAILIAWYMKKKGGQVLDGVRTGWQGVKAAGRVAARAVQDHGVPLLNKLHTKPAADRRVKSEDPNA